MAGTTFDIARFGLVADYGIVVRHAEKSGLYEIAINYVCRNTLEGAGFDAFHKRINISSLIILNLKAFHGM